MARKTQSPLRKNSDEISMIETRYNIQAIQVTEKIELDELSAFCSWVNNLCKMKYMVVTCYADKGRHILKYIHRLNDTNIRVIYVGYDNVLYETCDVAEAFDITARFKRNKKEEEK